MGNGEKIQPTQENSTVNENEEFYAAFNQADAMRARKEAMIKQAALENGVEPFDIDKALSYYRPDELTNDEETIRNNMAAFENEYYASGSKTIKEWAEEREKYDVYKDSTGHGEDA